MRRCSRTWSTMQCGMLRSRARLDQRTRGRRGRSRSASPIPARGASRAPRQDLRPVRQPIRGNGADARSSRGLGLTFCKVSVKHTADGSGRRRAAGRGPFACGSRTAPQSQAARICWETRRPRFPADPSAQAILVPCSSCSPVPCSRYWIVRGEMPRILRRARGRAAGVLSVLRDGEALQVGERCPWNDRIPSPCVLRSGAGR